jgi:copper chaperone CopZ
LGLCIEAVENVGFDAFDVESDLHLTASGGDGGGNELIPKPSHVLEIEGMMCQKNCGRTALNAILNSDKDKQGELNESLGFRVMHATVSFAETKAYLWLVPIAKKSTGTNIDDIDINNSLNEAVASVVERIEDMGFDASVVHSQNSQSQAAAASSVDGGTSDNNNSGSTSVRGGQQKAQKTQKGKKAKAELHDSLAGASLAAPDSTYGELHIGGMSCAACVRAVENGFTLDEQLKQKGFESIRVALLLEKAEISFDPSKGLSSAEVVAVIENLGYNAQILSERQGAQTGKGANNLALYAIQVSLEEL